MLHLPKLKAAMRGRSNPKQEVEAVVTYLQGLGHKKNPTQYQTKNPQGKQCHIFMFDNTPVGHICLVTGASMQPDIFFMEQTDTLSPSQAHLEHKGKMFIRADEMRANPHCMCVRKNPTKTMSSWADFKKWRRSAKKGDILVGVSVLVYKGDGQYYAISKQDKALPEVYNDTEAYIVLGERDIANIAELKGSKMALRSHKVAMEKGFPQVTKMVNEYLKGLLLDVEEETALSRRAKSLGEYKKQVQPESEKKAKKPSSKKPSSKKPSPKPPSESKSIILTKWLDQKILSVLKAEKGVKRLGLSVPQIKAKVLAKKTWAEQIKGIKIAAPSWNQSVKRLEKAGLIQLARKEGRSSFWVVTSEKPKVSSKKPVKVSSKKPVKPSSKKPVTKKTYKLKIGRSYAKDSKGNVLEFSSKAEIDAWFEKSAFLSTHTKPKKLKGKDIYQSSALKKPSPVKPKVSSKKKPKVSSKKPKVSSKKPKVSSKKPLSAQEQAMANLQAMLDNAAAKLD